jgi:hypothetical protein
MNLAKVKKINYDFGINIIASMAITITMQILIYPFLAQSVDANTYGLILTIMGIINTITTAFGNTLNNIRLVQKPKYEELNIKGDFNVILVVVGLLGAFVTFIILLFFCDNSVLNNVLLIFTVVLGIVLSYYMVDYRLNLKFKLNLYCSIVISIGYVVGLLLYYFLKLWVLPFFISQLFGCIFLYYTTKLFKEPLKTTVLFKQTISSYMMLIITGAIASALSYMDRLIIFPQLGGQAVSTFTVASFFGKSIGLVMTPIAGVLLSYYAQKNFKFTRKLLWTINVIVFICSIAFFGISCIFSNWFTGLLYPTIIEQAKPYVMIANIAAIIGIMGSMTQPAILKFAPMFWQVIIQLVYSVVYIGVGLCALKFNGIYGFCFAVMVANIVRLLFLYIVGNFYVCSGEKI